MSARETIENLWDRAIPVGPLLDAVEAEARAVPSAVPAPATDLTAIVYGALATYQQTGPIDVGERRMRLAEHVAAVVQRETGALGVADRAGLREQIAAVLRPHASLGGAPPRWEVPFVDGATPSLPRISGWRPLDEVVDALAAVLPASVDRATVLNEAADALGRMDYEADSQDYGYDTFRDAWNGGVIDGAAELRRLAVEARDGQTTQGETEVHPPYDSWLVEWRAEGGDWAVAYPTHDHSKALDRLARGQRDTPEWQWRLVRETTTYTVETERQPAAGPAGGAQQPKEA